MGMTRLISRVWVFASLPNDEEVNLPGRKLPTALTSVGTSSSSAERGTGKQDWQGITLRVRHWEMKPGSPTLHGCSSVAGPVFAAGIAVCERPNTHVDCEFSCPRPVRRTMMISTPGRSDRSAQTAGRGLCSLIGASISHCRANESSARAAWRKSGQADP